MSTASDEMIARAAAALRRCRNLCVLTGAGVSAESGVPTFRGPDGFWQGRRAEDLATPEGFRRDPRGVWAFYNWRRSVLKDVKPNAAHEAIAQLEGRFPAFLLVTQNVDNLHRLAGSRRMVEIHGNIWRVRCTACAYREDAFGRVLADEPRCPGCGAWLRPDVVWFGEMLPVEALRRAEEAAQACEVMLVAGTSGVVYPAAGLVHVARAHGATVIEVNIERTELSAFADITLIGKAGEVLPALVRAMDAGE